MAFVDVTGQPGGTAERTLAVLTHVHVGNSRLQTLKGVLWRDDIATQRLLVGQLVHVANVQDFGSCRIVVACDLSGIVVNLSVFPQVSLAPELFAARFTLELSLSVGDTEIRRDQEHGVVVLGFHRVCVVFILV